MSGNILWANLTKFYKYYFFHLDIISLLQYNNIVIFERKHSILEQKKLDRLNFLARKSKTEALTEAELIEQKALRDEYREDFRRGLLGILDNTSIQRPDGSIEKITKKGTH